MQFDQEEDDKSKENAPSASPLAPASVSSSGSSGGVAGTSNVAPAHTTTPSGRANIQQYLQANQGAGNVLSQGIQSNAQNQANQLGQQVNNARTDLSGKANPLSANLGDQASQKIQTAFKDPSAILAQQNQLSDFQKLRDQGYQGDIQSAQTAFGNTQNALQNQASQLGQNAQNAQTESGRFQLLRNTFGQPNYSSGQQRLDQLFLQAQPGVNKNLQTGLQNVNNQATQNVSGLGADATARFNALNDLSTQRSKDIQNLFQNGSDTSGLETDASQRGISDIGTNAQNELTAAQAATAAVPALRDRLTNNTLTDQDVSDLGLSKGENIYNLDLNKYISQNDKVPTLTGAANADEVARYNALQQLSGDTSANIFGGATDVGTYKPYDFNSQQLGTDLSDTQQKYQDLVHSVNGGGDLAENFRKYYAGGNIGGPQYDTLKTAKTSDQIQSAMNSYLNSIPTADRNAILKGYDLAGTTGTGTGAAPAALRNLYNAFNQIPTYESNRVLGAGNATTDPNANYKK